VTRENFLIPIIYIPIIQVVTFKVMENLNFKVKNKNLLF
jgi:hypothetical protein